MFPQLNHLHRPAIACALACLVLFSGVATAAAAPAQDLRNPDNQVGTSSLAGTTSPKQDLRSPDARDAARPNLPGPPTWPVDPKPISSAPAAEPTGSGGVDWLTIAIGAAGALLISGAAVALVVHVRRPQRVRASV